MSADDRTPLEELLAEIPPAEPRTDFARELRAGFVAGFPDRTAGAGPRRAGGPRPRRGPWLAAAAVAAAAVAVAVLGRGGGEVPAGPWVAPPDAHLPGDFLARLNDGAELLVSDTCDVCLPEGLDVRLRPGAEVAWVSAADADPVELRLGRGEVLIRTAADYAGPALGVRTPHGRVVVTGTALSVMVEPDLLTCVCVEHGTVRIEREGLEPVTVSGHHRHFAFAIGSDPWNEHGPGLSEPTGLGRSALMPPADEDAHLAPLREFAE